MDQAEQNIRIGSDGSMVFDCHLDAAQPRISSEA